MRPFGCLVTILNTIDHLGKFDGKDDEGFFVGYSTNSKLFNSRTRIVKENLHVQFSKNTPNIERSGLNWLFDIDELTKSMNYKPVVVGNQSNDSTWQRLYSTTMVDDDPLFSQNSRVLLDAGFKTIVLEKMKKVTKEKERRDDDEDVGAEADMSFLGDMERDDGDKKARTSLGLQVKQKEDVTFIGQDKYVTEILKKFGFSDVKTASTPMETHKPLLKDADVCACARFQVNPKSSHLHAMKRIFRYLKGQPKLGLWYPKDSPFDLVAYINSDYAGASLDRNSVSLNLLSRTRKLGHSTMELRSLIANSTTKAEYIAASNCCG
ncbi:hypothetical protein Tco_1078972 [Tanacetum coccineum]|uniref:Retroviral polymerase SH3-like domain-containing protein n=1 Tax=Tanacetum coccineum TaxID=301880 RepID=A0ABQ5HS24_9ASTR